MSGEKDQAKPTDLRQQLPRILAEHAEWLASDGKRGTLADLSGADLSGTDLGRAKLSAAGLSGADLSGARLSGADLSHAELSGANLSGARLLMANLSDAGLSGANLSRADARRTNLSNADLADADLSGTRLSTTNLSGADLSRVNLTNAYLSGATLSKADLSLAKLPGADLSGADLSGTDLHGSDLSDVKVNVNTKVSGALTDGCRIQRYTAELLSDLTPQQKMVMVIDDPVAELRSLFSGFWRFIHLAALTLFVFPYAAFLLKMSLRARFLDDPAASSRTLESALWQFIYTGGELADRVTWLPFGIFWFSLGYNALRLVLLFKTVSLEQHEAIRRLPAKFSLSGRWGKALKTLEFMFFVNAALVLAHTWHFLQMRVGTGDVFKSWTEILAR